MTRSIPALVLALSTTFACGGTEAPRPTEAPGATGAASAQAPVVTSAAPTAEASVEAPTKAAPQRVAVDVPGTLARLPKDAAIYGWLRLPAIDTVIDWTPLAGEVRREMSRRTGENTVRALLTGLGVETGAPIAGAVLAPDLRMAEKHLDALGSAKDPQVVMAKVQPNGTFFRFVARKVPGIDVGARLHAVAPNVRIGSVSCPTDSLCAELGSLRPAFLGVDRMAAYAVYVDGDRVELDVAVLDGGPVMQVRYLAARRAVATGGPVGRCTALDPEADLSVCVDPDRAAEMGAGLGMLLTASVLSTVDAKVRLKIAKEGKKESMRNIELSKPSKMLLDDGTLSLNVTRDDFRGLATWRTTEASAKSIESRFAEEKCADLPGEGPRLLAMLGEAFPDPGKDFTSANRIDHVKEAGLGGVFVVLGRSWPNLIKALVSSGFVFGKSPPAKVCAKSEAGRLRTTITGQAIKSF